VSIWQQIIRLIFLGGLVLFVISLPIFNVGLSIATIWLSAIWLIALTTDIVIGDDRFKMIRKLGQNKPALILIIIYLIHVIGLLYTEDVSYAMSDLRAKLPLFVIAVVMSGCPSPTKKEFSLILKIFLMALAFSAMCSLVAFFGLVDVEYHDIREITHAFITRISHIRLGILVAFGICVSWYLFRTEKHSWIYLVSALFFLCFIWLLQSLTGAIVLMGAIVTWSVVKILTHQSKKRRLLAGAIIVTIPLLIISTFFFGLNNYYTVEPFNPETADKTTPRGEGYFHDLDNKQVENGHFVWTYVAWTELENSWEARSNIGFREPDKLGHPLYGTLVRYMTSRGLRKDADGVAALSDEEIRAIESGTTSVSESRTAGLKSRVNKLFFEIDVYRHGGNPSGNSLTQRFEFWRVAVLVIKKNPWIGVGTGDVQAAMEHGYNENNSMLDPHYRLRAHNQYLSIGIGFGLIGLVVFVLCLIKLGQQVKWRSHFLFVCFFSMALLSFFTEDTLETQTGVSFFAFFSMFFLSVSKRL
jgi:O-antigen ligase